MSRRLTIAVAAVVLAAGVVAGRERPTLELFPERAAPAPAPAADGIDLERLRRGSNCFVANGSAWGLLDSRSRRSNSSRGLRKRRSPAKSPWRRRCRSRISAG